METAGEGGSDTSRARFGGVELADGGRLLFGETGPAFFILTMNSLNWFTATTTSVNSDFDKNKHLDGTFAESDRKNDFPAGIFAKSNGKNDFPVRLSKDFYGKVIFRVQR